MDNLGGDLITLYSRLEGSRCGSQPSRVSWITGTPPPVIKVQHKRRRNHVKMIPPVIIPLLVPPNPFIHHLGLCHSLPSSLPLLLLTHTHTPSLVVVV